jgi:hypothetical protein
MPKIMENLPKLVLSYPNLENLLDPSFMSYDHGISIVALVK